MMSRRPRGRVILTVLLERPGRTRYVPDIGPFGGPAYIYPTCVAFIAVTCSTN